MPTGPLSAIASAPGRLLLAALVVRKRQRNLLFLLLDEELLHGIFLVVVVDQVLELLLLLQHRPSFLPVSIAASSPPAATVLAPFAFVNSRIAHQLCDIVVLFLVVAPFVPCMVHSQHTTHDSCTAEIVNCKVCAALVLVFEERKATALAGFLVAD
jgi:hypothetical protein